MSDATSADGTAGARYVFAVRFRMNPTRPGITVEPQVFETTLFRDADPPGEPGWRFFRDNLWHGELADPDHFRTLTEDALGVSVDSVEFRELRTTDAYLDSLRGAVAADLPSFRADSVEKALGKYLGSSIHVVSDDQ